MITLLSKWDQIHEPNNLVENVIKNDGSIYKALAPSLDFTLNNGSLAYVSTIYIFCGDCGPANIEIYTSNMFDKWTLMKEFKCDRSPEHKIVLPGEHAAKFVRILCLNNIRGGNIVSIKRIIIEGIAKD